MNTDASNVEDINIPQVVERLSMSCIASLLKNGPISFAIDHSPLFMNDRDFRERFDSVTVSESISIIDDKLVIYVSTRTCFPNISSDFHT